MELGVAASVEIDSESRKRTRLGTVAARLQVLVCNIPVLDPTVKPPHQVVPLGFTSESLTPKVYLMGLCKTRLQLWELVL